MAYHDDIKMCHRCPRRGPVEAGGVCLCTVNGRPIGENAESVCPEDRFGAADAVFRFPLWKPVGDYDPRTGWQLDSAGNAGCGCKG